MRLNAASTLGSICLLHLTSDRQARSRDRHRQMTGDSMWDAFAEAIVRLDLVTGPVVLMPKALGVVGQFAFDHPVHIITAYNPAGVEIDAASNRRLHEALGTALDEHEVVSSAGSARDGSMAEPGYAVLGLSLDEAIELGRQFGQRAVYRWTADALTIVGVNEAIERRLGWALSEDV